MLKSFEPAQLINERVSELWLPVQLSPLFLGCFFLFGSRVALAILKFCCRECDDENVWSGVGSGLGMVTSWMF